MRGSEKLHGALLKIFGKSIGTKLSILRVVYHSHTVSFVLYSKTFSRL